MLLIDTRRFSIARIRTSGKDVLCSDDSNKLGDEMVAINDII
jgi:hypothetical protein